MLWGWSKCTAVTQLSLLKSWNKNSGITIAWRLADMKIMNFVSLTESYWLSCAYPSTSPDCDQTERYIYISLYTCIQCEGLFSSRHPRQIRWPLSYHGLLFSSRFWFCLQLRCEHWLITIMSSPVLYVFKSAYFCPVVTLCLCVI